VIVLVLYSVFIYLLGVLTVLQMTSKVGLVVEFKQLLSGFVRNKLGL